MIVRRRVGMPLLRGAIVGGAAYSMGRRAAASAQREQQQNAAIADLQAQQEQAPAAQPAVRAQVPAQGGDVAGRLAQLTDLLQQGALSPEEFGQAKAKVLAGSLLLPVVRGTRWAVGGPRTPLLTARARGLVVHVRHWVGVRGTHIPLPG
jgi:hypothetical protein